MLEISKELEVCFNLEQLSPELLKWIKSIFAESQETISPFEKSLGSNADGNKLWDNENTSKGDLRIQLHKEQFGYCAYCGQEIKENNFPIEHLIPKSEYSELTFIYHNLVASCKGNEPLETPINVTFAHGKTVRELFHEQPNNIFPRNHHKKDTFLRVKIEYYTYDKNNKSVISNNIEGVDGDFRIDKRKVQKITFVWSDKKHCDANKGNDFIYLLPLNKENVEILKSYLPAKDRDKYHSIEDNIEFKSDGTVTFNTNLKPSDSNFKDMNTVLNLNHSDIVKKRKRFYDVEVQETINLIETLEENTKKIIIDKLIQGAVSDKKEFYFIKIYFLNKLKDVM